MIYFISDTHFGHNNIIKYCGRPFSDPMEMDDTIIRNWKLRVNPEDEVYHLGDVSFSSRDRTDEILSQLPGRKYLIIGNHDKKRLKYLEPHFKWCKDYWELKRDNIQIVLSHYQMYDWNGMFHGSWMFHGHSHGLTKESHMDKIRLDMGVDAWGFRPVSLDEVKQYIKDSPVWNRAKRKSKAP